MERYPLPRCVALPCLAAVVAQDKVFEHATLIGREAVKLNAHAWDQFFLAFDSRLDPDDGGFGDDDPGRLCVVNGVQLRHEV